MSRGDSYYLNKDNLSRIVDAFNEAVDDAKNSNCGNKTVIADIDHIQREIEDVCPASWYPGRDDEFDRVRKQVKYSDDVERRAEIVTDFFHHITELIYNEFELEP